MVTRSLYRGQSAINGDFQAEDSVLSAPGGLCLRSIRLRVPPRAPTGAILPDDRFVTRPTTRGRVKTIQFPITMVKIILEQYSLKQDTTNSNSKSVHPEHCWRDHFSE